jgi:hypothetical protein
VNCGRDFSARYALSCCFSSSRIRSLIPIYAWTSSEFRKKSRRGTYVMCAREWGPSGWVQGSSQGRATQRLA